MTQKISKYEKVREAIRSKILDGTYPKDSCLPTEFQLVDEFGVSRITVIKALGQLQDEGLLRRIQGSGTYVLDPDEGKSSKPVRVGVFLTFKGHVVDEMARAVIASIQARGAQALCVDIMALDNDPGAVQKSVEDFFKDGVDRFLVDGLWDFPHAALAEVAKRGARVSYVLRCENELDFNFGYSVTDDFEGGRMVAEHLFSLGHRNIVFVPNDEKVLTHDSTTSRILKGLRFAMADKKLNSSNLSVIPWNNPDNSSDEAKLKLRQALDLKNHPTAICTTADYIAVKVCNSLRRWGFSVPEDISVTGYFDTPWATHHDPKLTSVSIDPPRLAELAVNALFSKILPGNPPLPRLKLIPNLIQRLSTNNSKAIVRNT
jgi:GntR family transcriptional regulator of arabinose operon